MFFVDDHIYFGLKKGESCSSIAIHGFVGSLPISNHTIQNHTNQTIVSKLYKIIQIIQLFQNYIKSYKLYNCCKIMKIIKVIQLFQNYTNHTNYTIIHGFVGSLPIRQNALRRKILPQKSWRKDQIQVFTIFKCSLFSSVHDF